MSEEPNEPESPDAKLDAKLDANLGADARQRDVERFEQAHRRIRRKARQLGESHDRKRCAFRLFDLQAEIKAELAQLRDVFEKYPDCEKAVGQVQRIHRRIGVERRLDADRFAVALAKAIRGLAIQYHRIVSILISRTPEELGLIKAAFQDRYRDSFRDSFERMSRKPHVRIVSRIILRDVPTETQRLDHLLAGERNEAYVDTLYLALRWRWGKDETAILSLVSKWAANPRRAEIVAEVRALYAERYGGRFGVATLDHALMKQLSETEAARVIALLDGNEALATVIELTRELERRRPRVPVLSELLRAKTRRQLKEIRAEWRTHRNDAFARHLSSRRWKPALIPVRDLASALVHGKAFTADAAHVRAAVLGHSGCWIGEPFVGRSPSEREAVIQRYERVYKRDFWGDLRRTMGTRTRYLLLESFIVNGHLSKAELLRDCMYGFGTDEQGIKDILEAATESDVREMEIEYRKFMRFDFLEGLRLRPVRMVVRLLQALGRYLRISNQVSFMDLLRERSLVPRDLWMDLEAELDGDDWLDAQLLRDGKPSDPVALYLRTAALYEHERGGRLSRFIDWVCHDGEAMDRDFAKAKEFYQANVEDKTPNADQLRRLHTLVSYASHAFESFRTAKHSLSFILANVLSGGLVACVAAIVLSMKQPLALVMVGCFVVSAFTRMSCRWVLSARGYGREKVAQDVALATIDGMTFAVGTAARQLLGGLGRRVLRSKVTHKVLKGTSSFVLKRLVRTSQVLNEKKRSQHLRHSKKDDDGLESDERDVNELVERLSIYT